MKNREIFEAKEKEILSGFDRIRDFEEGKERCAVYEKYAEVKNAEHELKLTDNIFVWGVLAFLLMALALILKLLGYAAPVRILWLIIGIAGLVIGWLGASFAGIFLVVIPIYILYTFMDRLPALFTILCLAGTAAMMYMAVKEQKDPGKLLEKKLSNLLYPLEKEFKEADKQFKYRLITELAMLSVDHYLTAEEFHAETDKLFEVFKKPHDQEIENALFTDTDKMYRYAQSEFDSYEPDEPDTESQES